MQLTLKKLKTLINEVLSESSANLPPEKMEKLMKLLKNEDPSFVTQGIEIALTLGMDEDEIINLTYDDDGWQKDGVNWVLLENFPTNQIFTNLTELDLSYNQLTSLPDSIGNLTNLTELYLDGNELTSLPDWIGNLTNLRTLDLYGNKLTSLPDSMGNLTNLKKLVLEDNPLKSLPSTLVALRVDTDQWNRLQEQICNIKSLQFLDLREIGIRLLPNNIGNLTNLTELYLDGNKLTSLPDSIGNLKNLTILDLSSNDLASLPDSIGNLKKLKYLSVARNGVTLSNKIKNLKNTGTQIQTY